VLIMGAPVVFIHGLWVAKTAWQPWIDKFAAAGHEAVAPGWPGEGETPEATRARPETQAGVGIDEVTAAFGRAAKAFDTPPVLVGHSFGGLIAQKLLGQGVGAGAVAISPAPMKGVLNLPISQLRSASPVLGNPTNRSKAKGLTREQYRYAFGNTLTPEESDELYDRTAIPSPAKPLFEGAVANFSPRSAAMVEVGNSHRGPLLIVGASADHTVPASSSRSSYQRYRSSSAVTEYQEFDGRGHSLTLDKGWPEVADRVLEWLGQKGL
jgi:alpha-beta hydrolase superfamily lysophospholipase